MTKLSIKAGISAGALATALMIPTTAFAQDGDAAANADAANTNVILVTARGREENLQEVPLAISAFDAEDIDRLGLQGLDDVARFTPGFSFESFSGGFPNPVIRGQAQTRNTALESNVSSFYDGIYIPRAWAVDVGTANLERVEIVKGPQSARYGRNAFSGAINYVPRKAEMSGDIYGTVEATIGSDERYDGSAFINISGNDQFGVAGSYSYSEFDGSWNNAHPFADLETERGTRGNAGGWKNESAMVSAIVEPVIGLRFDGSYTYTRIRNEARASRYFSDGSGGILDPDSITATDNGLRPITNCGTNSGTDGVDQFALLCGEVPGPADSTVVDPRSYGVNSSTDIWRFSAEYDVSEDVTVSYTFGNIFGEVDIGTSGEPNPVGCGGILGPQIGFPALCNFQVTPVGDIDYDSHEARLTFDSGNISGAIGGFYSEGVDTLFFTSVNISPITDPDDFVPFFGNTGPRFALGDGVFNIRLQDEVTTTETAALFGEVSWTSPDDMTRISAEGRYSEVEINSVNNRRNVDLTATFKEFTPRVTVERDFNPDVMGYITVARGAKAGGFNATAVLPADQVFDPEYNWTYEAGVKGTFADGRIIFDIAAYYTDWTNIQINAPDDPTDPNSISITRNLGNAELYGVEFSTNILLTDTLGIDATFSHTEGSYSDGTIDGRFRNGPCDDVVCSSDGDISGNNIERTTPTQASAGIQYDNDIGDNAVFARIDGTWQAEFFVESANLAVIPERFLVNAAAGITFDDLVSVRIWARNLLDKKYVSNAFFVPGGITTYGLFFGERRTFGVTAALDF